MTRKVWGIPPTMGPGQELCLHLPRVAQLAGHGVCLARGGLPVSKDAGVEALQAVLHKGLSGNCRHVPGVESPAAYRTATQGYPPRLTAQAV